MKAFVTGSTGLLGNNLVRLLVEQGHEVKVLVRSKDKAARIFGNLNVTPVQGDMENIGKWAGELSGCEVLFHAAAFFREYFQPGDHWKTLETINVKGTIQLLEEAEKYGIHKVIYTSSSGVIGMKPGGLPGDETTAPGPEASTNLYFKSKVLAEAEVAKFLTQHKLPVIIILPGAMVGPGDSGPTGIGQMIIDFTQKKLPGLLDGGFSLVDARDVAQAMLTAVEQGQSGERYLVGGNYADFETIAKTLEKVSGVPAPTLKIPYAVSLAMAFGVETFSKITKRPALITLDAARTIHVKGKIDSGKAKRELGASFRPLEESLFDSVEWYRKNGYLSPKFKATQKAEAH